MTPATGADIHELEEGEKEHSAEEEEGEGKPSLPTAPVVTADSTMAMTPSVERQMDRAQGRQREGVLLSVDGESHGGKTIESEPLREGNGGLGWEEGLVWLLAAAVLVSVVGRLMLDGWLRTPEWLRIASTNTSAALTAVVMVGAARTTKCWREHRIPRGPRAELLPTIDPIGDEDEDD